MAHHAYVYAGERAAGIASARAYAATRGIEGYDNPDIAVFEYGLFSVDDARRLQMFATQAPVQCRHKCIVLATGRLFHEAQNALLKLFEEPSDDTSLVLIVPSDGVLLPTLRSRLIPLPGTEVALPGVVQEFLASSPDARGKYVTKLLARSRSEKETEKQEARLEAATLVEGITRAAYAAREGSTGATYANLTRFLADLARFTPLMHDRSTPLKLILEHILATIPQGLTK